MINKEYGQTNKQKIVLIKPEQLMIQPGDDTKRRATIIAEPLERGFGLTLGNALRRVLLSSLQGAAVTSICIDGILHEFASLPGVREDIVDIILNIKSMSVQSLSDQMQRVHLEQIGPCEIKASMIKTNGVVTILDPDLIICTLDRDAKLRMEMTIERGRGYGAAIQHRPEKAPIGLIPIDALFSPVRKVSYKVENTRVGQMTDYEKLSMDIETNGSVSPEEAIDLAAEVLQEQFSLFRIAREPVQPVVKEQKREIPYNKNLLRKINELELSVRSANCLKNDNIVYIGDLVRKTEADMLRTPNFGRKSLNEINEILKKMNLHLGMTIAAWPPENIEELAKQLEDSY